MALRNHRILKIFLLLFWGFNSAFSLYGKQRDKQSSCLIGNVQLNDSSEEIQFPFAATKDSSVAVPHCKANCRLCHSIRIENWQAVKAWMKRRKGKEPAGWTYHRNILYIKTPDAILMSLPTYTVTTVCFKTGTGEAQAYNRYQLGVVRPVLGQIKYGFDFLFRKMGIHFRQRSKRSLVSNPYKIKYLGFRMADQPMP